MDIFDRYWSLRVKSVPSSKNQFDYTIKQDSFGNALRVKFDISASVKISEYTGQIDIYNLNPDQRKNLQWNLLAADYGTGPSVQLEAGYKDRNGIIFNGALNRGFTRRQPESGDWVTTLQVGIPLSQAYKIQVPQFKIIDASSLWVLLSTVVRKMRTQPDRIALDIGPDFESNLEKAIDDYFNVGNTINEMIGFNAPVFQILAEIDRRFKIKIYYDHSGINVVSSDQGTPIVLPYGNKSPEVTIGKDSGMVGSPIYTDTGAKIITFLNPEYKMFQLVRVNSDLFDKDGMSITSLKFVGDTYTNEWFSELDGSKLNRAA